MQHFGRLGDFGLADRFEFAGRDRFGDYSVFEGDHGRRTLDDDDERSFGNRLDGVADRIASAIEDAGDLEGAIPRIGEIVSEQSTFLRGLMKNVSVPDDKPMVLSLTSGAWAEGLHTVTGALVDATIRDQGRHTIGWGEAWGGAAASGGAEEAGAESAVRVGNADAVFVVERETTGPNSDMDKVRIVAVNFDGLNWEDDPKIFRRSSEHERDYVDVEAGNFAFAGSTARAFGENTYVRTASITFTAEEESGAYAEADLLAV